MSMKAVARELYKAQQKVHRLRDRVAEASGLEREKLSRELRQAEAECTMLRRMVDGHKATLPYRTT